MPYIPEIIRNIRMLSDRDEHQDYDTKNHTIDYEGHESNAFNELQKQMDTRVST